MPTPEPIESERATAPAGTSRRDFLRHALAAGLAVPALGGVLGACSGATPRAAAPAAGAPAASSRGARASVTFVLDWIPFGRHAPYYVALDKGYYGEAGLDVTIQQGTGTTPGLRALVAGQAQFNFNDIGSMIAARSQDDLDLEALACIYQKAPHTIFFIKGQGIERPKDLEGKKIAYSPGDSPKAMFPAFAKANGIDESKISWASVDPNSKNSVLLNHQVDAMMTYILTRPVLEKAAQDGDQIGSFVYGDWGADFYANGLIARRDVVAPQPDLVRGFVKATLRGFEYTFANPSEAVAILHKYQPQLDEDSALKEIDIIKDLAINDDTTRNGLGHMNPEKMQQTRDLTITYLGLKGDVPVDSLYTNAFLPRDAPAAAGGRT